MKVVQSTDENIWRQFVEKHPDGNIFHTPEMFEVFQRAEGFHPSFWGVTDKNNQLLALLLPVHITLMEGILKNLTTRSVAFGSVLASPGSTGGEALRLLLNTYKESSRSASLFTELRNLENLDWMQDVLIECGFVFEEHLNYLINLDRSSDELLNSLGKRTRKRIRRLQRNGEVVVKEINNFEQIGSFYDLLVKSYSFAQVPLADRSLFEAAYELLNNKGMVRFYLAWVGNDIVAGSAELLYKDTIYGWYGGVDRNFSTYSPNELLMWYILNWGAENGFDVYDFGGAGKPDKEYGVRDFKAKFGGELVGFGRNTLVHSQTRLAISKFGYEIYRRLRY